jgi:hypothetical protein
MSFLGITRYCLSLSSAVSANDILNHRNEKVSFITDRRSSFNFKRTENDVTYVKFSVMENFVEMKQFLHFCFMFTGN